MQTAITWLRGAAAACALASIVAAGAAPVQAQTVSGPIAGRPTLQLGNFDLAPLGYVAEEFFLSGAAVSYQADGPQTNDGLWAVKPGPKAAYTTRLVVVRPSDPAKFNGTVVVEWLNVSAGTDGAPDWSYTHRELIRQGYAYVGVSAQKVGIDGGGRMGFPGALPIKKADPQRYASLNHPGDAYSFDIFTQAARAIRGDGGARLLGPLVPKRLIGDGESQSAMFLTTYVDAIEPVAHAFDGFLIHSRFGGGAPLDGAFGPAAAASLGLKMRTDLHEPVFIFISETDLLGFGAGYVTARQPDSDHLRTWEVAGTAHADTYTLGGAAVDSGAEPIKALADSFAATHSIMGMPMPQPMNAAPQHHYVMMGALSALNQWITSGKAPPLGQRLEVTTAVPTQLVRDANGNALGGVRTPWMDVPTARLTGLGQTAPGLGMLFGVTEPFDAAKLAQLYPGGKADYLKKFDLSLKAAVRAGFIPAAYEQEIRDLAAASYPGA
ncbi:MAG TPA: alpha/beta hydrolase domain-containing protein [Caulobacteraceae bacterium]|jgi:hypothetical protein